MLNKILKIVLRVLCKSFLNYLLRKNKIVVIFRNGSAIGDHVYLTSVLREISEKKIKIILFSNFYELYENNFRIYKLFRFSSKSYIWFFLNTLIGSNILEFRSTNDKKDGKHFLYYHKNNKKIHLCQAMSEHFNLNLKYSNKQNEFFFSKEELRIFEKNFQLPNKFSLIQSGAKKTYTANKDWSKAGMQNIIDYFDKINWIQVGISNEPRLKHCKHLMDLNLRSLAYVIYKSEFIVSYEGLLNHLASCFNKKIFIIHTGFLHINAFKYKNNIIIENNKDYSCYPCFDINCIDHKKLTKKNIKIKNVIREIEKNIYIT